MIRYRRFWLLPVDVAAIVLSHLLSYLIRFEAQIPPAQWKYFWVGTAVALVVKPAFFVFAGFYRRLWRYASIPDLVHIVKTVTLSSITSTIITLFLVRSDDYSRSTHILAWLFLNGLILGRSLVWRLLQERRYHHRTTRGPRLLIVGAGMAGKMLFQEIKCNRDLAYSVIGFLDDDPVKIGARINDRPVLGAVRDLARVARDNEVKKVIIAIPSAPASVIRNVVRQCRHSCVEVQTLPPMSGILREDLLARQVRDVKLEDLLGRAAVSLDTRRIEAYLAGKRILVTGAGGSIGSEICRQLAHFAPHSLTLFEAAETPLHEIGLELGRDFANLDCRPVLGDIRDREQVFRVFREIRPQVVFHAAAYKHVPMMEWHPSEAIKTNLLGTRHVAEAAAEVGVEKFVMVSTDKAVNPTSVMGASKRSAELFVQALDSEGGTEFITVRFGNVLGSNGSVVPLFQEQIRRGGPVTVTHRDVVRYFMTIPEASQLVLQAGSLGSGGEIYLLDMGEPVRITDLAEELIRLSGLVPHEDIRIVFTGLRPGEKLFEELLISGEGTKPTEHQKICIAAARTVPLEVVRRKFDDLAALARSGDEEPLLRALHDLVPEYRPGRISSEGVSLRPVPLRASA
ncbi:MAG: polysaccharide biosynthesis protein [Deltaproteobacteria bacterium]|nr:polysaccharide biosynthesis protein [Deltaproteobacteria bacterium]